MKASLKFREDRKPLLRAKVPLSIVGLPFQSGIVAGESKELTLNLSTFFESGPSIKISYRPNDSWNPFSLVVKSGTGPLGSPISSSMLMSAEFNLLGRGNGNPSFMIHFKPRFGDFSLKKSQRSVFDKTILTSAKKVEETIEAVETPVVIPTRDFAGILSGVEMTARTSLPVRSSAVLNFRWGVKIPTEMNIGGGGGGESMAGIDFKKIPFLVMNKIGFEHVDGADSSKGNTSNQAVGPVMTRSGADVAEICFNVKKQLDVLQSENGMLKKAVEDLRQEIVSRSGDFDFESGNGIRKVSSNNKSAEI